MRVLLIAMLGLCALTLLTGVVLVVDAFRPAESWLGSEEGER